LLLVDDEPSVLRGLRRVLETNQSFWEIHLAADGEEALEIMKEMEFDAIITDLHMPRLSGPSLLLRVSQLYPKTIRIVHSARCDSLASSSFGRLVQRTLPKPATAMDVLEATSFALAKRAELSGPASTRCA
jgi:DNA-binding NarL/FixJ family response regulator